MPPLSLRMASTPITIQTSDPFTRFAVTGTLKR